MAFLVKTMFRWNESSKNADISILSNFLAIFFGFCSPYSEILPSTIYMSNFRSIGPSKQNLQRGGGGGGAAIPICKKPGLFRVKKYSALHLFMTFDLDNFQLYYNLQICAGMTCSIFPENRNFFDQLPLENIWSNSTCNSKCRVSSTWV